MRRTDGKITAHMIVKNEDQWVWFAIMSVIDYVDKMIIFDTGSVDRTVEIIQTILEKKEYQKKIHFEEIGSVTPKEFTQARQRQLDITDTEYIMLVDGDEIWWKDSMEEVHTLLKANHPLLVSTKMIIPVTDIFHYKDYKKENYRIDDEVGSINGRIFSLNINQLKCSGDYGVEGYFSGDCPVHDVYKSVTMENFYFHCSKLRRTSAKFGDEQIPYRRKKIFDDWDYLFPEDYQYPEVFYLERPSCVPDPFKVKDNFTKNVAKKIIRVYRFLFKRKDYVRIKDRKNGVM